MELLFLIELFIIMLAVYVGGYYVYNYIIYKTIGFKKIALNCNDDKIKSQRIIIKNGGIKKYSYSKSSRFEIEIK